MFKVFKQNVKLWKKDTKESMDKDVYRFGPGVDALVKSYKALYNQIKSTGEI